MAGGGGVRTAPKQKWGIGTAGGFGGSATHQWHQVEGQELWRSSCGLEMADRDIERPNGHKTCRKCFAAAMRGTARKDAAGWG
jgi:hypothetical protein